MTEAQVQSLHYLRKQWEVVGEPSKELSNNVYIIWVGDKNNPKHILIGIETDGQCYPLLLLRKS